MEWMGGWVCVFYQDGIYRNKLASDKEFRSTVLFQYLVYEY